MKILQVIPSMAPVHGGPSKAARLFEAALSRAGVEVHTATTDDDGPGRRAQCLAGVLLDEGEAKRIYFPKRTEFYKSAPGMLGWLWRNVRHYDVVHIHALFSFSSMAAAWIARAQGVPYVLRPLGTLGGYGVKRRRPRLKQLSLACLEGPALRRAAAVHFTSEDEEREAAFWGVPMRGVVIPLGIEPAQPAEARWIRARFPALGAAPYLLFLSRLDPKKNLEALLNAFAEVRPNWPDLRLLIAGGGEPAYVGGLTAMAESLGLADLVVWTGHLGGDLKASALAGAVLFVLPSFSENFGIAAAEALMAGLPCVLGQGVAIAGDVAAAGAGLSVAPDAASVAAALNHLLADAPSHAAMSTAARRLAQERFSAKAMGANLVALYEWIAAAPAESRI